VYDSRMSLPGGKTLPWRKIRVDANEPEIVPARAILIAALAFLLSFAACSSPVKQAPEPPPQSSRRSIDRIKPISGTLINIQWPDARYKYMNEQQAAYTCDDWALKVSEMAEIGIRYIVFQSVAQGGKAFYRSNLMPGAGLACDDPVGAVMRAAEEYGMRVFLSCEFVYNEDDAFCDPRIMESRLAIMREVAAQFGASPAFYGWYFSAEEDASALFGADSVESVDTLEDMGALSGPGYVEYVNTLAAEARKLTPGAKILIALRALGRIRWDDEYLRQLGSMDVDIVAYQDKVGSVRSTRPLDASRAQFALARTLHDRIPRIALWADIETFAWEGSPNSRTSALVPAPFSRVLEQMAAVSPYVERTLAYTMLGMADKPGSPAPTGHPTAQEQYRQYEQFLDRTFDMLVLTDAISGHVQHAAIGAKVTLKQNAAVVDGGSELVDGSTASIYNTSTGWVAFKDGIMDITVDLGTCMTLDYIGIHLLAEYWNGIFLPDKVNFSVSADGAEYVSIGEVESYPWYPGSRDPRRDIVAAHGGGTIARYVRITSRGIRIPSGINPARRSVLASEVIIRPRSPAPLARRSESI
jgi:hypothetical protein